MTQSECRFRLTTSESLDTLGELALWEGRRGGALQVFVLVRGALAA